MLATATLLGSASLTLVRRPGHQSVRPSRALMAAAVLMAATGFAFAGLHGFWPLLLVAFVGTLNPSSGDVSVFLPLEHTVLAQSVPDRDRTALFARYSFVGVPRRRRRRPARGLRLAVDWLATCRPFTTMQRLFGLYAGLGLPTCLLYRGSAPVAAPHAPARRSLGPSRRIVYGLAALFSLDAFGGGFVVNALLALWLFQTFGLSRRHRRRHLLL